MWKRALVVAATLAIAALGAGYSVWMLKPEPPRRVTRFPIPLPEGQRFTDPSGQLVAISPDGTTVVYVANQRLYLRPISGPEARTIPGSEGDVSNPVFSPDGRAVAFYSVAEAGPKRLHLAGGAPVTIAKMDRPFGLSWSEQGIVFGRLRRGIFRVPATGGVPEMLVPVRHEVPSSSQVLPGGRGVLFSVRRGGEQDRGALSFNPLTAAYGRRLSRRPRRPLPPDGPSRLCDFRRPFRGAFRPGQSFGDRGSGSHCRRYPPLDIDCLARHGPVQLLGNRVARVSEGSAPGERCERGFGAVRPDGQFTLLGLPMAGRSPRVSPDGKFVAFDIEDANGAAVWVYELAGDKPMRQLTFGGKSRHPIWSRDGQWVTFQADREGDLGIFRQRADGSGAAERLTNPETGRNSPAVLVERSRHLLFSVSKEKVWALGTLSLKDRKVAPFGDVHSTEPAEGAFSPVGQWVVYRSSELEAYQARFSCSSFL